LIFAIASIIVIVILVKKKENYYNTYYVSDFKEEYEYKNETGRKLKYRLIDVNKEHYIGELNEAVKRTHVRYYNRYGIELAGDLYEPKLLNKSKKYKAIVIGPPYGGVKEQGPSVYANELASRGFIALAFDPSFNGESGGRPRKVSSSDIFMEDFSAGVDYLGTLKYVDREKIGGIGICGSGGFLIGAASIDIRIKAVITVVMYDIPHLSKNDNETEWNATLKNLKKQRWEDVDNNYPKCDTIYESDKEYINGSFPSEPEGFDIWRIFYSTERGHHPRSTGGFTETSLFSLGNLEVTNNIKKISPRPILFITGDMAHSKDFSIEAFNNAENPKELYQVNMSTTHIDLYDNVTMIPFDKIESFLNQSLEVEYYE
jgi:fermentation-respiration switch protein FrsA (DUF1100 family)